MKAQFCRSFFVAVYLFPAFAAIAGAEKASMAGEQYSLRAAKPDASPVRVNVNLEVGGNLKAEVDKKPQQYPMSVVAQFGYDEQRIDDGSNPDHRLALRYYDDTQAVIKVGDKVSKPQLREARRLIAATAGKDDVNLLSPQGPLTREELDLIDIPGNTLVLDELLPTEAVEKGHRWKPSGDTMARLLGLDAVGHTELECQLVEVQDNTAEITIDGTLGGAINGVASDMELKGKLVIDLERHIPKSLLLAIKEQRGIGHVAPGLDVVAKLKLTISPLLESKLLTADILRDAKLPQTDEAPSLEYRSEAKGYRFLYDRRWHITREEPELIVLRLVDRGDLIAQCNVAPSSKAIDKPVELTQFQTDVQSALGKMFGRFEQAGERSTESGLRVLQAKAVGTAAELPIQWRYYLVHDHDGRALSVVFTLEAPLVEQFHDQDKPILESVEFLTPKMAAAPSGPDMEATEQK
jgi:hypothetical protein